MVTPPFATLPSGILSLLRLTRDESLLSLSLRPNIPLMRDVMVGFFGLSNASPFCCAPFVGALPGGGSAKFGSGCECSDEAVDTEGAGEATGFDAALCELPLVVAAMVEVGRSRPGAKVSGRGFRGSIS